MSPISHVNVTAMKISTYWEIAGILPHCTSPVRLRPAEEEYVDGRDRHHGEQHRADLRHRQTDADRRLDEIPVDAEEDDDDRGAGEDGELRGMALSSPTPPSRPSLSGDRGESS